MNAGGTIEKNRGQRQAGRTGRARVTLFAQKSGLKLFAAKGKLEIQAQNDELEIIADKVMQLISQNSKIHISSPTEILLTADESYVKINASGVESGTNSKFIIHSAKDNFIGPQTMPPLKPELPGMMSLEFTNYHLRFHFVDDNDKPYADTEYTAYMPDGGTQTGITDKDGFTQTFHTDAQDEIKVHLHLQNTESE